MGLNVPLNRSAVVSQIASEFVVPVVPNVSKSLLVCRLAQQMFRNRLLSDQLAERGYSHSILDISMTKSCRGSDQPRIFSADSSTSLSMVCLGDCDFIELGLANLNGKLKVECWC